MTRMIIKPKALSETLQKYEAKFGHRPSAEAYKFSTDQEINYLASKALLDDQPVEDWESRPFRKTGTILDALYDDSVTSDAMKNTRSIGIVKKVSTKELREIAIVKEEARQRLAKKERKVKKVAEKELREIAIAKEEARQWLAKKEKKVKQDNSKKSTETLLSSESSISERDYSMTYSVAKDSRWIDKFKRNYFLFKKNNFLKLKLNRMTANFDKQAVEDFLLMNIVGNILLGFFFLAFLETQFNLTLPLPKFEGVIGITGVFIAIGLYGLIPRVLVMVALDLFGSSKEFFIDKKQFFKQIFEGLAMIGLAFLGCLVIIFILKVMFTGGNHRGYDHVPYEDRYPPRR